MAARHLDVKTRLQGEDGCAGGDGDVAPLHGPPFSDPWSGVRSARRKFCAAATSSSGWRRRAEIEVVALLQSSDDVRHVGELRSDFRFDTVQLPCEALTLRAAVRANPYGFRA
jgi:hypothetical protein